MKRRLLALLMCAVCMLSMTACGTGNDEGTEIANGTEASDSVQVTTEDNMPSPELAKYSFTYSDYVTLGDYSAIPVELSEDYEITDEDVENYIKEWFNYYGPFYKADDTKTVIEAGDIVNVDYVGKLDGVAFDGGTAKDQNIDVSGNCSADGTTRYIDGFTAGLLGAEVGTTVDCDVTFPENYGSEDLAGKAVVFTFTVNAIQKEIAFEEIDDDFAVNNADASSVEEMYTMVHTGLTEQAAYYKADEQNTAVQTYLLDVCTVEIPADYFADLMDAYRAMFIYEYCDGDEASLEEFLSTNYGYTIEQAEESWRQALQIEVKLEFILGAIAEELGITLNEEAYKTDLAEMLAYYGMTDETIVFESYGYGDAVFGEKRMKDMHIQSDVIEKLLETAIITIAKPEEATEASTETVTEQVHDKFRANKPGILYIK